MRTILKLLAVICFMPVAALAAEDQFVVIAVTGQVQDLKAGQRIAPNAQVNLPVGASAKLLSASGQIVTLKGPHAGTVATQPKGAAATDDQVISRLAKFLGERQVQSGALGVIRAGPPRTREPTDPLMVVVGDRGQQCARGSNIQLWRRNAELDASLEIRSATAGTVRLAWPKGANAADLPRAFAVDRTTFEVSLDGLVSNVSLHLAPATANNPATLADWMVGQKCDRQAALFLSSLE